MVIATIKCIPPRERFNIVHSQDGGGGNAIPASPRKRDSRVTQETDDMPSSASSRKADDYESPANILGEPYVLKTLLYLFDHGSSKKTDLYENVSRNLATRHRLDAMSEAGLIDVNRMGNVTLTIVSLTDTGRAVVEKFREIEAIMAAHQSRT